MTKKDLAQKVGEYEFDGESCQFFAQGSKDGKGFALFIKSTCEMDNDDVLQALDVFMAEAISQELDMMGNLSFTPGDQ